MFTNAKTELDLFDDLIDVAIRAAQTDMYSTVDTQTDDLRQEVIDDNLVARE